MWGLGKERNSKAMEQPSPEEPELPALDWEMPGDLEVVPEKNRFLR